MTRWQRKENHSRFEVFMDFYCERIYPASMLAVVIWLVLFLISVVP